MHRDSCVFILELNLTRETAVVHTVCSPRGIDRPCKVNARPVSLEENHLRRQSIEVIIETRHPIVRYRSDVINFLFLYDACIRCLHRNSSTHPLYALKFAHSKIYARKAHSAMCLRMQKYDTVESRILF